MKKIGWIKILNIITTVALILIIALVVLLYGGKLFGIETYAVISGSMEPTYHTGSVIFVKKCSAEKLNVGDPVSFYLNESRDYVATHRIVEMDDVEREIVTKGDANEFTDVPTSYDLVIGKPLFSIPALGFALDWVKNEPGRYLALAIAAVIILLCVLPEFFKKSNGDIAAATENAGTTEAPADEGSEAQAK